MTAYVPCVETAVPFLLEGGVISKSFEGSVIITFVF
jgi:hypothetical protein